MALITYLTRIQFDFGALSLLADEMALLGIARPLVVTDRGLLTLGMVDRLVEALADPPAASIFDDTPQNPTEDAARAAAFMYRDGRCDGVIGYGGGSSMDLAKAVALMATHDGPLARLALVEGGVARITSAVAPVIAIPTTAGTGSEVGRGAVIIMDDGRKLGVISPRLIPRLALCDPELTHSLPPSLTAATGLDALAHCVETFIAPAINPPAEAIALDGAARIAGHLATAVADGADRDARWHMMMAAMQGAMAFQKGLGAIHALSHPCGAVHDTHHGLTNAVIMPYVLAFNRSAIEQRMTALARYLDLPNPSFDAVQDWVLALRAELDIAPTLAELGIRAEHIDELTPMAAIDPSCGGNPVPVGEPELRRMFEMSVSGELTV